MNAANPSYDLMIIGGGPAGLSAAIYGARDKLSVLIIEKGIMGGLITETERVDNYPAFPEGISGFDLTERMFKQAQKYGTKDLSAEVLSISKSGDGFLVKTTEGDLHAGSIIVSSGASHQKLDVPGEKEYTGRGVAYCATCDAPFYSDKTVAVAGGGNAALYEAMHLTKFAKKVFLVHRRAEYRATPVVQEQMRKNDKIVPVLDTVIESIEGADFVEKLKIKNVKTGEQSSLAVDGIFVAVGLKPNTGFLDEFVELDKGGSIIVDDSMRTSVPGVFAAGDVRHNSIRQTVAASGDGAVAAIAAKKWLDSI
jgi:thioredoxin reductase (NADPH)